MNVPLPSNLAVVDGSPEWFSRADNAWKLIAATLVGNPSWSAKCSRAHNLVRWSSEEEMGSELSIHVTLCFCMCVFLLGCVGIQNVFW